jgi:glycosyltransferase involved in cell wall biosynthesis
MVTPTAPESAIADVMLQTVPYLMRHWDLEIWSPTATTRECDAPIRTLADVGAAVLPSLRAFDLAVYVLGDSPYHRAILPLAREVPGLAVVHDASLTHLVWHSTVELGDVDAIEERITEEYGSDAASFFVSDFAQAEQGRRLDFCAEVPLDTYAVERSLGAVVHSRWHGERLAGQLLGAVSVAPMPAPSNAAPGGGAAEELSLLRNLPSDAILVVTVGTINANRHIDVILDAIAGDPTLLSRVHLWAVGGGERRAIDKLRAQAAALGLADRFATTGRVSDRLLDTLLARADVAVALRSPVLEGQSASVLTQMQSGTPVVVYDHAHYSELPDDVARKVDPTDAVAGLQDALRGLVEAGPDARRALGQRGNRWVRTTRSGEAYAGALLAAADRALAARPLANLAIDLAARLELLGLQDEAAIVENVADLAFELFDVE